jgi:hypothetical protein
VGRTRNLGMLNQSRGGSECRGVSREADGKSGSFHAGQISEQPAPWFSSSLQPGRLWGRIERGIVDGRDRPSLINLPGAKLGKTDLGTRARGSVPLSCTSNNLSCPLSTPLERIPGPFHFPMESATIFGDSTGWHTSRRAVPHELHVHPVQLAQADHLVTVATYRPPPASVAASGHDEMPRPVGNLAVQHVHSLVE